MRKWTLAIMLFAALSSACTVVFEVEKEQCSTDDDCQDRGGEFADSVCVAGFCRGLATPTGCQSNAECTGTQMCIEQECTKITNLDCPMVINEQNLRSETPIVYSIFSPIDGLDPDNTVDIKNYKLAIEEFERELPGGPDGLHPFAALICDSRKTETAMPHAIEKVRVPAVVAGLSTDDLTTSFEKVGRPNGVFFLSPYDADSTLTSIKDDSLIWHMLGSAADLAPAYVPLMTRIESHLAAAEPLRVAMVEGNEIFELDLADAVAGTMKIGGVVANANPSFARYEISPEDPTKAALVVQKLLTQHRPHVIISAAGEDFMNTVLYPVEQGWNAVNPGLSPPFYVLSMENRFSGQLVNLVKAKGSSFQSRLLGINYASAEDLTLKQAYLQRYGKMYPNDTDYEGYENHYDTIYFLLYSFIAAGDVPSYTGSDLARGITRLLSGPRIDVGPLRIPDGTAALQPANTKISLFGTFGPPDFDAGNGARRSKGSVWCITLDPKPVDDVLRLDDTEETLVGDFPCFAF